MVGYEYKIIPAPSKGLKAKGVKGPEARFANALELRINELAAEGWEYQRSDILPSEERQGLTSTHTVYRSVLVFRRELMADTPRESVVPDTPAPNAEPLPAMATRDQDAASAEDTEGENTDDPPENISKDLPEDKRKSD